MAEAALEVRHCAVRRGDLSCRVRAGDPGGLEPTGQGARQLGVVPAHPGAILERHRLLQGERGARPCLDAGLVPLERGCDGVDEGLKAQIREIAVDRGQGHPTTASLERRAAGVGIGGADYPNVVVRPKHDRVLRSGGYAERKERERHIAGGA